MHRLLMTSAITAEVDPKQRVTHDGSESQTTALMMPPDRVALAPSSWPVGSGADYSVLFLCWWADVGKIRLSIGAVILQDGEEARHAVKLSRRPVICPLRLWVPVVMHVKLLASSITDELRGAHLVYAIPHDCPHELGCSTQYAVYNGIFKRQACGAGRPFQRTHLPALLGYCRRLEQPVTSIKQGFDLGRAQERMDVDQKWIEGHDLRAICCRLADISGTLCSGWCGMNEREVREAGRQIKFGEKRHEPGGVDKARDVSQDTGNNDGHQA